MNNHENLIAVVVDNEFQEQYFSSEEELNKYVTDIQETGSTVKAMVMPKLQLLAILKIQEYAKVFPDANTIILAIEEFEPDEKIKIYKTINSINKHAFSREYFDYFIENRLLLSDKPEFDPLFAEKENTLNYVGFLKMQIGFLQELVSTLHEEH